MSEKQRLNVACHLLLDADIIVLDRPTRGMDIFDTFFLVEYLRQWAARGRIVILTLQVSQLGMIKWDDNCYLCAIFLIINIIITKTNLIFNSLQHMKY